MTQRRLWLSAVVLAALVQAGFVAAYHHATSGCFCAMTTNSPEPPAFVTWTVLLGMMPLRQLLQGTSLQVDGWIPILFFAAANLVFWAAGFFALLHLVALPWRLRLEPASGTPRRIRLRGLAAVKPRWLAAGILLLMGAGLVFGAQYRRWWLSSAREAVHVAVGAVRAGEPYRRSGGHEVECYGACGAEDFAGAFTLKRFTGDHPLDRFVAPVEVSGRLDFAHGSRYMVYVYHKDGTWKVLLGPAH